MKFKEISVGFSTKMPAERKTVFSRAVSQRRKREEERDLVDDDLDDSKEWARQEQ